ncbi:MAG TPA: polymer-forming cytoskeletal protein [Thermomicrobiales bacterium]|jgi:cytoskeletal protein CcmA (bactofilin family)|nr:polymer-forming cytoskeletal protein [Thermomicrobiales bacterium]
MSIRTTAPGEPAPGDADYGASEALSLIDRHSTFDGTFRSDRDVRIEGDVKGSVICQGLLFIAQGATVNANVEAENVTVAGDLEGEVACRGRLQLLPSGRMRGKVSTGSLVINEGAYYEGQLEMAAPDDRARAARAAGGSGPVPITAATENRSATTFIRRLGSPETAWEGKQDEPAGEAADSGGKTD